MTRFRRMRPRSPDAEEQQAVFPQRDDLTARVRETLERCAPVTFDTLSPASDDSEPFT